MEVSGQLHAPLLKRWGKSHCYTLGGRLVGIWRKEMSDKFGDLRTLLLQVLVLLDVKLYH